MKLRPAMEKLFSKEPHQKAQSAMEYLMTYGWAILIIAVVLGALFQLGVFNANNFAPKAPPGACHVSRPNGPSTTSFINLEGVCSGELPQYVAQFNGQSSVIQVPSTSQLNQPSAITISLWIKPTAQVIGYAANPISKWTNTSDANYVLYYFGTTSGINQNVGFYANAGGTWQGISGQYTLSLNQWYHVVLSYTQSGGGQLYINGQPIGSASASGTLATSTAALLIGANGFPGEMANFQLYNTSLSANEIQALYLEGIGGAPIDLQNLVGWWPLNGNANDYSGNGNNGQATAVTYTGSWTSGYTPP